MSNSKMHYVAVLDISKDKSKVYISNPWNGGIPSGWVSIDDLGNYSVTKVEYVTNDGPSINYGAGGSSSGPSSTSSVNMSGNITEIKDPDNPNRSGYKINVDWDKEIDGMLETLKKKDYKLEKYLDKSLQKEYLKNMLKAAIVTQYPDLRSADEIASDAEIPADETQGCIKIKRYADGETQAFAGNSLSNPVDSEDGGMYLTYMPYSEFSQLIASADKSALNYFSMDSSNNLVVAGWETLDVSVTIEQIAGDPDPNPDPAPEARAEEYEKLVEKKINYVNQVSNYTMPFSYLWSLLVYGNDEDFVNDVAKLVIDTDIVIASYDATTTKKSTYTNKYDKHNTIEDQVYMNHKDTGNTTYVDYVYTYRVTETHILKTDTPSLNVVYANTWVAIYNKDYKVVYKDSDDGEGETIELEDDVTYQNFGQAIDEKEIKERLENNEEARKNVENERQRLKQEAHNYNQDNFSYRYDIINKKVNNELLKIEDVQNYLINMIIDQNTEGYITNTFKTNEIIVDYAKEITGSDNPSEMLTQAATEANKMVREANNTYLKEGELSPYELLDANKYSSEIKKQIETNYWIEHSTTLWNELTKNGEDTRKNRTYEIKITGIQYQDIEKKENQTENIKTEKNTAKVQEVTSNNNNVKFKTDKNSKENSFVKLLYHSKKAKGNLKIIDTWFFESMEETAAIADMVDLTKYMFQKVYNEKITYTEEEITEMANLFDPEKFSSISNSGSSVSVSGTSKLSVFLQAWENSDVKQYLDGTGSYENASGYITQDKKYYIMFDDGYGTMNYGFGVCISPNGGATIYHVEYFREEGIDITDSKYHIYNTSTLPVEIVDNVKEKIMEDKREEVRNTANSIGVKLEDYQVDALAACRYQGWYIDEVLISFKQNGLNDGLRNLCGGFHPNSSISASRAEANWVLFSTGKYMDEYGNEITLK